MPSPRYIICCETQILDRSTGSVSHINVFDGFTVVKSQEGEQLKLTGSETLFPKFIASAVWAEDDDDVKGAEYDWEFRTHAPNREPRSASQGTFIFERRFNRFDQAFVIAEKTLVSGVCFIEHRIRVCNTDDWISQRFEYKLVVKEPVENPDSA